jgi:hypothetical protein
MFNQAMFVGNDTNTVPEGNYILSCSGCQLRKTFTRKEFNELPNTNTSLCAECDKKIKRADKLAEIIWKDVIKKSKKFPSGIKMQRNGIFGLRGRIYKHLLGEHVFNNEEASIIKPYLEEEN